MAKIFALDAMPSTETRMQIAKILDMSPKKVQIWFQNRRARLKTLESAGWSAETFGKEDVARKTAYKERRLSQDNTCTSSSTFVFHNLALCDDGQLVLCSESSPPIILPPSLQRHHHH